MARFALFENKNKRFFEIVQNESKTIQINILDDCTGLPEDLTGITNVSIKVADKDTGDPSVQVTGSLTNATLGQISIPILNTDSAEFILGTSTVEIELTDGATDIRRIVVLNGVRVTSSGL